MWVVLDMYKNEVFRAATQKEVAGWVIGKKMRWLGKRTKKGWCEFTFKKIEEEAVERK